MKSIIVTNFRRWAPERRQEYMIKGFTLDDERLKQLGGGNHWHELLDCIRDIRSSEKALYRQVLDLYATSVDYDPKSEESVRSNRAKQVLGCDLFGPKRAVPSLPQRLNK